MISAVLLLTSSYFTAVMFNKRWVVLVIPRKSACCLPKPPVLEKKHALPRDLWNVRLGKCSWCQKGKSACVYVKACAFTVSTRRHLAKPWCFVSRNRRPLGPAAFMSLAPRSEDSGFWEGPSLLYLKTHLAFHLWNKW